jgi:hypothetical protein
MIKFIKNNSFDDSIRFFDLIFDLTFEIESNCQFQL